MKYTIVSVALFCVMSVIVSCNKSIPDDPQPVNPVSPTNPTNPVNPGTPPAAVTYSYTFDSSFLSTGSFATLGALQPDGKIIIANPTQIARLDKNGILDISFATGSTTSGEFHSLALQKDGKVLLGGSFTNFNGQNKSYYLRLNTNGSIDNSFNLLPVTDPSSISKTDVRSIAIQADNKILLGGNFFYPAVTINGGSTGPKQLIRVNENGTYDASFQHQMRADFVNGLNILANGQILVTGQFVNAVYYLTPTNYQNHNVLVRLNTDGSLDPSFKWPTPIFTMRSPYTYLQAYGKVITPLEDGRILLGGRFQSTSSVLSDDYSALVRVKADGNIDNTLPKRGFDGIVSSICLASDRIIIGRMHDPDRNYLDANIALTQLNKDGTDNDTYKVRNFTGYGETYGIIEDANKNLILIGKFYDKMAVANYTFHGVIRLKKL